MRIQYIQRKIKKLLIVTTDKMEIKITELTKDIYKFSKYDKLYNITFNQFLLVGKQESIVIETGHRKSFNELYKQIEKVCDPKTIKHIIIPHFEADEVWALVSFIEKLWHPVNVYATAMCGESIEDVLDVPVISVRNDEVRNIDKFSFKFIHTPHVHQRDCMIIEELTNKILFSADIFILPWEWQGIIREDVSEILQRTILRHGYMPSLKHLTRAIERFENDDIQMLASMHGQSIQWDLKKYFKLFKTLPL